MRPALFLLGAVLAAAPPPRSIDPGYAHEIDGWRAKREEGLRAPDGWLAVVGLHWLREGRARSAARRAVTSCLPIRAPRRDHRLHPRKGGHPRRSRVTVKSQANPSRLDCIPTMGQARRPRDRRGQHVRHRPAAATPCVKDGGAQRRNFRGLEWYPVREDLRIRARFTPYDPPKKIPIANVVGMVDPLPSPGYVTFQLDGRELRLEPVLEEPDAKELFYIFRDATAGRDTYPAGRFLYSEMPKDGQVVLDFNKAYSPPCAFTSFATCPLPPRQNRLDVRIEAGEKKPAGH
jgi:uncharacterized protein (DUF1684 family)